MRSNLRTVAEATQKGGGKAMLICEYPKGQVKETEDMIRDLKLQTVECHGCALNMKSEQNPDMPPNITIIIGTDSIKVRNAMKDKVCKRDHFHAIGHNPRVQSPMLARIIVKASHPQRRQEGTPKNMDHGSPQG